MGEANDRPDADVYSGLRLEQQLCFALYAASNEFTRLWARRLKTLDLTFPQYLALLVLIEHSPMTVGAFGKAMRLDFSTATPLIQRMELAGLVERRRDKTDERRVYIDVTDRALALQDSFVTLSRAIATDLKLSSEKADALRADLHELAEMARSGT